VERLEPRRLLAAAPYLVREINPGFPAHGFGDAVHASAAGVSAANAEGNRAPFIGAFRVAPGTAPAVIQAGADILVAGSAVFGAQGKDYRAAIAALRARGVK